MEKKNIVDSLVGIIKETEEQDKMLQSQNAGWRKELRERFDWTQNTTIKGKVELEKFIQELLDKARKEGEIEVLTEIFQTCYQEDSKTLELVEEKLSKLKDNKRYGEDGTNR